jgi:hypothetical protein
MWMISAFIVDCARAARRPDHEGWCPTTVSSRGATGSFAAKRVRPKQHARTFFSRYRLSMRDVERGEWERVIKPAKHKYVWIEARRGERRELIKLLPPPQPYPKRFRLMRRNSAAA